MCSQKTNNVIKHEISEFFFFKSWKTRVGKLDKYVQHRLFAAEPSMWLCVCVSLLLPRYIDTGVETKI